VSEGYPPELLWVKTDDVLLGFWLGRFRYFVWQGDPSKRQGVAQIEYENALKRKIGMDFLEPAEGIEPVSWSTA
jgi:hypothetical protein